MQNDVLKVLNNQLLLLNDFILKTKQRKRATRARLIIESSTEDQLVQ